MKQGSSIWVGEGGYFDVVVGPLGEEFGSSLEADFGGLVLIDGDFLRFGGNL